MLNRIIGDVIFVLFMAWVLYVFYDMALCLPRRYGLTRRKGLITRFVEAAMRKMFRYDRDDFGEYRSVEWRRKHGIKDAA